MYSVSQDFPSLHPLSTLPPTLSALIGRTIQLAQSASLHGSEDREQLTQAFGKILSGYTLPGRHHHALSHLTEMAEIFETLAIQPDNELSFLLALCAHDSVYEVTHHTKHGDNERASALLMKAAFHGVVSDQTLNEAEELILATASHQGAGKKNDTKLLIDLDMAVLAREPEKYRSYADAIRKEYAIYNDEEYVKGRSQFILGTLKAGPIFFSRPFQSLEQKARSNLRQELRSLSGSQSLGALNALVFPPEQEPAKFIESNSSLGKTVACLQGPQNAHPIVLCHGTGQTLETFDDVVTSLAVHSRVCRYDLFGHARSSRLAEYSIASGGVQINQLIPEIGNKPVTLIGASISGMFALQAATDHPELVSRVVLVDSLPSIEASFVQRVVQVLKASSFESFESAVDTMMKYAPGRERSQMESRLQAALYKDTTGQYRFNVDPVFLDALPSMTKGQAWNLLLNCPCPVYLIRGAKSAALASQDIEQFRAVFGDESVVTVENAGHSVVGDNPVGFLAALDQYLS